MSKPDLEVTSRIAPLMLIVAQQLGLDMRAIAERWKLPSDLDLTKLAKAELVTSAATLKGLSEELATTLGDPHFGLTLARALPRGAYGVAEFLVKSAPTMRVALENLLRFNQLITPNQTFSLVEKDDEAQLHHAPTVVSTSFGRHLNEYSTAALVASMRTMVEVAVLRVWFINPPPASTAPLVEAFGTADLVFDQPTNGFALARANLELAIKGGDPALFGFLEEHALAALASRPKTDDLIDRLRRLIREALQQGEPNIERLSMRLQMSGRTLQRRLSELSTSFQDVLDGVRFDLARAFLREDRLDVSQVAYLLGYSELRAFDRAFKRWSGVTPGEYRSKPSA